MENDFKMFLQTLNNIFYCIPCINLLFLSEIQLRVKIFIDAIFAIITCIYIPHMINMLTVSLVL